jgi:hypothetical protein
MSTNHIPRSMMMMMMMMMMILHHMRHGRQDNHATNHVRCTKTQGRAKQKAYRGQTKQNHILLKRVDYNAYPAKQWKSIMSILMGETQLLCTGAREPGSMGLLGVARANTAVGVSPETFLLLLQPTQKQGSDANTRSTIRCKS